MVAEPLEQLLVESVLRSLDGPELAGRRGDSAIDALSDGLAGDQAQLDDLAVMFGKQEISAREWRAAREPIEQRPRSEMQH